MDVRAGRRGEFKPLKANVTGGCLSYHTESIKRTNMYSNRSLSSPDVRSFYCQPSQVIMVGPCLPSWYAAEISYYNGQRIIVIAEEDRVNHGWTTLRHGQACRCHHWYASWATEVDGHENLSNVNVGSCCSVIGFVKHSSLCTFLCFFCSCSVPVTETQHGVQLI